MEKQKNFLLSVPAVALATLLLLSVPLVAMQFTTDVNWSVSDFIVMGALLFGAGITLMLVLRAPGHMAYRAGLVMAIGATFLMIWANLAVGLIGSGPNAGNLMYLGVVGIIFGGIYLSKFKAVSLERAMYVNAFALVLHTCIALLANMQDYPGSSVTQILGVNLFFATPFILSGLLFRYVAQLQAASKE